MNCFYCHEKIQVEPNINNLFKKEEVLCKTCLLKIEEKRVDEMFKFHNMNVHALFDYSDIIKRMIRRYKFQGDASLHEIMAMFIKPYLRVYKNIVPVPVSNERLKERGFNQITMMLDALKIEYMDCITSTRQFRQSELSKYEREQLGNPFKLKQGTWNIENERILIVDDIFTTGETVRHVNDVLSEHCPESVDVLTFSISRKF